MLKLPVSVKHTFMDHYLCQDFVICEIRRQAFPGYASMEFGNQKLLHNKKTEQDVVDISISLFPLPDRVLLGSPSILELTL